MAQTRGPAQKMMPAPARGPVGGWLIDAGRGARQRESSAAQDKIADRPETATVERLLFTPTRPAHVLDAAEERHLPVA